MEKATETKEITVEEKLRALYDLQLVASEIDKKSLNEDFAYTKTNWR